MKTRREVSGFKLFSVVSVLVVGLLVLYRIPDITQLSDI